MSNLDLDLAPLFATYARTPRPNARASAGALSDAPLLQCCVTSSEGGVAD